MGCGENCPKRGSLHLSPGQGVVGVLPPLGDLVIRTADPASRWGTARIWIYDEYFCERLQNKIYNFKGDRTVEMWGSGKDRMALGESHSGPIRPLLLNRKTRSGVELDHDSPGEIRG